MIGHADANYKMIQRFLARVRIKPALLRLFQADAPYVIGDVTEMPRLQARKTAYVGALKDGKTKGFWFLTLATPYRGRAIPCSFVTYSSKTIANMEQMVALVMLAFAIGLLIGESARDRLYTTTIQPCESVPDDERVPGRPQLRKSRKWKLFSGLFLLLLKHKLPFSASQFRRLLADILITFKALVCPPVRTFV